MDADPGIRSLHAAWVAVDDLDRAADLYARLLDTTFRPVGGEGGVLLLHAANVRLALVRRAAVPDLFPGAQPVPEGQCGLSFAVADPDRAAAALLGSPAAARVVADVGAWHALPRALARGIPIALCAPADAAPAAATQVALDHVVVLSEALERAIGLYGDRFGLRLALDRSFERRGVRILFFRASGVTLEVAGPITPPAAPGERDRFGGLAWRVPDVGAAHARLEREGFDVSAERPGHKPGTRVFSVREGTCGVPTLVIGPDS